MAKLGSSRLCNLRNDRCVHCDLPGFHVQDHVAEATHRSHTRREQALQSVLQAREVGSLSLAFFVGVILSGVALDVFVDALIAEPSKCTATNVISASANRSHAARIAALAAACSGGSDCSTLDSLFMEFSFQRRKSCCNSTWNWSGTQATTQIGHAGDPPFPEMVYCFISSP